VANGTGPYRINEGDVALGPDFAPLGRFDGYWGEKAKAAGVTIAGEADAEARLQALHLDSADGIDDPSAADLGTIAEDSTLQLVPRELLDTTYIGMNSDYAPFDNVNVRRVLAMGIDRQQIMLKALPPGSSLARFFTPCSIEFGCDGDPWYDLDVAGAKALLANVALPGPLTTHVYYREGAGCSGVDPSLAAKDLQSQLQGALGISADLRPLDPLTFADKLSAGLFDGLYVADWCAAYPDVTDALNRLFNDPADRQFGTIDRSITDPLTTGATTADPTARKAAYAAANSAIRAAVPMIPIAHGGSAMAWKADVTGAVASPLDAESFASLDPGGRETISWMQTGSPRSFYCADAPDGDSVRLCANVFEQLYAFKPGTASVTPGLATSCDANAEMTVWTCHLRSGVTFHDGASLDANDVLQSFAAEWDYTHPVHRGGLTRFAGWTAEFGPFLNAAPAS
jgi:ABC-type transport system substrate-binding protein